MHKPDLVFIEFATNDAFEEYSVTFDEARGNLSSMIKQIREQNALCEIAIVIMNPVFGKSAGFRPNLHSYYDLYREVAKACDCQLIDIFSDWQKVLTANPELQPQLIPDGLHPSQQGCERVITPSVLDALGIG